ncbi:hypothetical protein [Salibacter halophilus]|uniref:Glycosyltransferase RgtA/B/C/D-like domain-containing protein n=1 Tax=Salibacter halophilus TaxID=1803916 RepID=A0A6N6MBD7_9FLAO|nr:hypothetical protein [Salibacter halophilus]KAB1064536.1 hypothetical protein F3059_07515 [Salibacter halophilus]
MMVKKSIHFYLGLIILLALMVFSFLFDKERVNFLDTSFLIFQILQDGANFFDLRFVSYFNFIPSLIGGLLELDLKLILLGQSIWFAGFHLVIFLLISLGLKKPIIAFAQSFALVISTTVSFYYPVSEVFPMVSLLFLFIALVESSGVVKYHIFWIIFISTLIGTSHPIFILFFPVVLGAMLIKKASRQRVLQVVLGLIISIGAYYMLGVNSYDESRVDKLFGKLNVTGSEFIDSYPVYYFWHHVYDFTNNYMPVLVLFILLTVVLAFQKKFISSIYFFVAGIVVFVITCFSEFEGNSGVVMDKAFMTLGIIPALMFIHVEQKRLFVIKNPKLIVTIMIFLFAGWKVRDISMASKYVVKRYYGIKNQLLKKQSTPHQKFVATAEDLKQIPHLGVTWNLGVESLFITTMEKEFDGNITLIKQEDYFDKQLIGKDSVFIGPPFWGEIEDNKLNPTYFELEGVYQKF